MERRPVRSSNIASIGYDPEKEILEVEFLNGGVYRYTGILPEYHHAFVNADSPGRHFMAHIRGKFPVTKMEESK
jgi:KTSC domain